MQTPGAGATEGRVTGTEFRQRREALGKGLTIAAMATLAGVGTGVVDKWERGVTRTLSDDSYWQLVTTLQRLESGDAVVVVAQRSQTRGGAVVLTSHEIQDVAALDVELDRIAREDG